MTPEQFTECTAAIHVEIEHALNKTIPMKVANLATKLFKESFQNESFFGQKWPDVRRRTHPPKRTKYPADRQRKILTGRTGNLGRSIRWRIEDRTAIVYSDVVYSRVHNEGAQGVGRKRRARIPQRQFIGQHKQIDDMVKATIDKEITLIFKKNIKR